VIGKEPTLGAARAIKGRKSIQAVRIPADRQVTLVSGQEEDTMEFKTVEKQAVPATVTTSKGKLAQVLNESVLREVLDEGAPVEEIVENLFRQGHQLFKAVRSRLYANWGEFKQAQQEGNTELVELEGPSTIDNDDVVILRGCPMADEMAKLHVGGKPPAFHKDIVEGYMEQNPGSNALLHPGCIAHQVARQLITRSIEVGGVGALNYYQLACRSLATGKVVYDDNGLKTVGMSKEKASELIDGYACLYVMVRENAN
jgi:hypothetical protein